MSKATWEFSWYPRVGGKEDEGKYLGCGIAESRYSHGGLLVEGGEWGGRTGWGGSWWCPGEKAGLRGYGGHPSRYQVGPLPMEGSLQLWDHFGEKSFRIMEAGLFCFSLPGR